MICPMDMDHPLCYQAAIRLIDLKKHVDSQGEAHVEYLSEALGLLDRQIKELVRQATRLQAMLPGPPIKLTNTEV